MRSVLRRQTAGILVSLVVFGFLLVGATAGGECELERLAGVVEPPARFADHEPDFRVVEKPITYHWWRDGELAEHEAVLEVVMDGDKPVAILPNHFFAPYPGADTRDWIDETFNPRFRRFGVDIPNRSPGATGPSRHEVLAAGEKLVFEVRRGSYVAGAESDKVDGSVTRFTLGVDPRWGYVLERRTTWRAEQHPTDNRGNPAATFHAGMWYSGGITQIWPDQITYRYSGAAEVLGDDGDGPRYTIWSNNAESMFRPYHPTVRSGGFVANLRDSHGWGVALTHEPDEQARYSVCPIWGGYHPHLRLVSEETRDGVTGEVHQRIVTLPPEVVEHIIDEAKQVNDRGDVILVRVDGEDFEDQPLPAGSTERGFQPGRTHGLDTGQSCRITTAHAHSGEKSLEVDGMTAEEFANFSFWPRDRGHTRFLPGRRYRLECRVKVEGEDTEAFIIPTPAMGVSPTDLVAGEGIGEARTETVRAGDGWRKVSAEFTAQLHGNPINVRFVVIGGGKGYFDDFRMYELPDEQ